MPDVDLWAKVSTPGWVNNAQHQEVMSRARVAAAVMVCAASLPAAEGLMITLKAALACK